MTFCQSLECVRSARALEEGPPAREQMVVEPWAPVENEQILLSEADCLQRWLDLNA